MKRASMLRGPRRSAKQTVIKFMNDVIRVLDTPDLPPERRKEFRNHLGALLVISRDMNWDEITNRIKRWVVADSRAIANSKRGVFTEPE